MGIFLKSNVEKWNNKIFHFKRNWKKIDESGYKIIKHGRRFSQKDDGIKSFLDKMDKCSLIDDSFNFEEEELEDDDYYSEDDDE